MQTLAQLGCFQQTLLGIAADPTKVGGTNEQALVAVVERPDAVANPIEQFHQPQSRMSSIQRELECPTDDSRVRQGLPDGSVVAAGNPRVGVEEQQDIARGLSCSLVQCSRSAR